MCEKSIVDYLIEKMQIENNIITFRIFDIQNIAKKEHETGKDEDNIP